MFGRWSRGALNGFGLGAAGAARDAVGTDPTTMVGTGQPGGSASPADVGDHASNSAQRATETPTVDLPIMDTAPPPSTSEGYDAPHYRL